MDTPVSSHVAWRFGVYEVDTRSMEVRRAGVPIKIRDQSFLILVHLLEHAGEIVTREELRRVLWPSDTFVDFDHSLSTAIMKLRDVLSDSAETPIYIETIPKHGYRFIAPVTSGSNLRNGAAVYNGNAATPRNDEINGSPQAAPTPTATPTHTRLFRRDTLAIGLIILFSVGSLIYFRSRRAETPQQSKSQTAMALQIQPVTNAPGSAVFPAFSPEGREVAFL